MNRAAFVGFGEVNTPRDIILRKCEAACQALKETGLELIRVFPVSDDGEGRDVRAAVEQLKSGDFDVLILCVAGWIPSHAVISICEEFRHKPMALWGLCGWLEEGRLITTADQAGTSALRKAMTDLGYRFRYFYDVLGRASKAPAVADFVCAASAARRLRAAKIGMGGYRDMRLYGTLCDGASLKRTVGCEVDCFELLEVKQRYDRISDAEKRAVVDGEMSRWRFLKEPEPASLYSAAGYYLAVRAIARERGYSAVSLKDVDGMKRLLGFPPAPVFMLLSDIDGLCTVPENDCLGSVTQLMIRCATGQCGAYLEFYEFFEDRVLAGVPDFVPREATEGETTVIPAAFGELSEGILNVSKVKTGPLTMARLTHSGDRYALHLVRGEGVAPRQWEEAGWTQPAPQLPGLEILLADVENFAQTVMSQHYFICYGDQTQRLTDLCGLLGIEVLR